MTYILPFIIVLFASSIGALTGMGGGVIIKPVLDTLGTMDAADIGILSSVSVFAMSIVSAVKQRKNEEKPEMRQALSICGGAVLGGYIGDRLLYQMITGLNENRQVVIFQNAILAALIVVVIVYMGQGAKRKTLNRTGILPTLVTGLFLGMVSAFLGIGGGPINVALILLVTGCSMKQAAAYSILTIFFAQVSKLLSAFSTGALQSQNMLLLAMMVAAAITGGWAGSKLRLKLENRTVEKAFSAVQVLVLCLCAVNILKNL